GDDPARPPPDRRRGGRGDRHAVRERSRLHDRRGAARGRRLLAGRRGGGRQMIAERATGAPPVLRVENVSKNFAGVAALSDVSLEIAAGEIVGVVGDNGAGKSTLVKTISGEHQPSSGTIQIDGQPVVFGSPAEARELGIETIYQDLGLVDHMDAAQNFFLGRELTYGGVLRPLRVLRRSAMRSRASEAVEALHVRIPEIATRPVARMSGGQRQAVAIARGVFWGQKLMLLD